MEEIQMPSLIATIANGFPMFGALLAGWILAEIRARRYFEAFRNCEQRSRAVLRDAAGLASEDATNGGSQNP